MRMRAVTIIGCLFAAAVLVSACFVPGCTSGGKGEGKLRAAIQANPLDTQARIELAKLLHQKGSPFEGVVVLQDGIKLDPGKVSLVRGLAELYTQWAEELNSSKKYEMAAQYWQQVVDSGTPDADTLMLFGKAQHMSGQSEQAAETFAAALRFKPEDAALLQQLAWAYMATGKYEKAETALQQAVKLSPNDYQLWWSLGDAQRMAGEYETAVASTKKAVELSPKEKRSEVQEHLATTEALLVKQRDWRAYRSHYSFAQRHKKLDRLDRIVAEYKAALEVVPEGAYGEIGWCNQELAGCYNRLMQPEVSREYAYRSIEAFEKAGDHNQLAFTYQDLAMSYRYFAKGDRKKEFLEKALQAHEMQEKYARQAGNQHMARHALADRATVLNRLYGIEDARVKECRQKITQELPQQGPVSDCSFVSIMQAEAVMRRHEKDYDGAKKLLVMLEPYYADLHDDKRMKNAPWMYNELAYLCCKQDNLDEAIKYCGKAVAAMFELRSRIGVDSFKRNLAEFGGSWQVAFSGLVAGSIYKKDNPKAFNYSEECKARALLDLLGTKSIAGRQQMLDKKQNDKRVLLARVQSLEKEVEQARTRGNTENVRGLERTLSVEKTNYDRLAEDVSVAAADVRNFEEIEAMKTDNLQPMADQFTVVSYVIGYWGLSTIALSKDGIEGVVDRETTEDDLRALVDRFRGEIGVKSRISRDLTVETQPKRTPSPEKVKKGASEELYKLLIEPVRPYIKTKLIIISPDSVLNYLPFEALQKNGRYLIEDYAIAYAPSASVLKICMDRNRNRREKVLALGNPNLKNPAFRLVHAEEEVNSLKGLFPQVDVYTGDNATERVLQEHGSEYDILHFACHGELNLDEPMLTSLRLAPDDENDGYLHAGEVFDYDLSASLVVLSACNSALGELTSGNELMGLTRSFLYAGVPSIVASLWTVDDRSTAYLMQEFYRNLGTMTKADALREAKLAAMKKYPSPFHWAAFCLQGDYR